MLRCFLKGDFNLNTSFHCSIVKKITALLISICLAASFVPYVCAASEDSDPSSELLVPENEPASQTTEATTQAAGYGIDNAGYGIDNAGYRIDHAGYGIDHTGYRIDHAGYRSDYAGKPVLQSGVNSQHCRRI